MPRLDSAELIERMLRDSGGVEVVYGSQTTYGHFDERDVISDTTGTVTLESTVMIATGTLTGLTSHQDITVDGTAYKTAALKPRRIDDGGLTRIILKAA